MRLQNLETNFKFYNSDKALKGTVVNLALPFFHGGLLEIMPTVPLNI